MNATDSTTTTTTTDPARTRGPRLTHFVPYDAPGWRARNALTYCGIHIDPTREHAAAPTCPTCRAMLAESEELVF